MSELQIQLNSISELLQVASISESEQEKNVAIKACIRLLNELDKLQPSDSEVSFLIGYAWYLSPESEQRDENVLGFLSRALEQNFQHQKAKVYLCHYFFDLGGFSEFLKHYKQIERTQLIPWRRIKFAELNLVAKAALNLLEEQEINWYIQDYENSAEKDQPKISELYQYWQVNRSELPSALNNFIEKWSKFWGLEN